MRMLLAFASLCLAGVTAAQQPPQPQRARPRVLLIGDTSLQNHFRSASKALAGEVDVVISPLGHLDSGRALRQLDELLQRKSWDLICCNFGLSDLMHRDPRSLAIRAMSPAAGGVRVTSTKQYPRHLDKLVARMRTGDTKLAWLTTLPLHPRQRHGSILPDDIASYRKIETGRMQALAVSVVDTHQQVVDLLATAKNKRAADRMHGQLHKRDLSGPLVAAIRKLTAQK